MSGWYWSRVYTQILVLGPALWQWPEHLILIFQPQPERQFNLSSSLRKILFSFFLLGSFVTCLITWFSFSLKFPHQRKGVCFQLPLTLTLTRTLSVICHWVDVDVDVDVAFDSVPTVVENSGTFSSFFCSYLVYLPRVDLSVGRSVGVCVQLTF